MYFLHAMITAFLIVILLHSLAISAADDCPCNDSVCLYEPIRSQLTSTPNTDSLFLGFFTTVPFYGSVQIISAVNLTVHGQLQDIMDGATPYNIYNETMWMHFWYPYTSTGVLRKLFPAFFRGAMDPWSALPVVVEVVSNNYFVTLNLSVSISCVSIDQPPNSKSLERSLNDLYSSILQWGKSFGRTNGPGTYADDTDRGIVYDARDLSSTDVVAFNIFVLLYVVFNFTVAILIIPAAPIALRTFLKQIQRREYIKPYIKSLFWSAVFTGALYIAVYIVIKIVIFTRRDIIKILANGAKVLDLIDDFTITSVVVPLFLFGVHIITAIHASRAIPSELIVPQHVQHIIRRFCCQSCTHVLWTFSLWVVLAWLQLIAVSFIPVVISILTDTFRSIAVFGLLFTTIACVVVCSAVLLQTCKANQSVPKVFLLLSITACFFSCLTVGIFTSYFLVLSQEGLEADTIAGYVLSLIPSLALAALAYFAENILHTSDDAGDTDNMSQKGTGNEQINVGDNDEKDCDETEWR